MPEWERPVSHQDHPNLKCTVFLWEKVAQKLKAENEVSDVLLLPPGDEGHVREEAGH